MLGYTLEIGRGDHAGDGRQGHAQREHHGVDALDVDAQRFGHVVVEGAGADLHAQARLRDQQVQAQRQRDAHARHHQPVDRVRQVVGERDRGGQGLRDVDAVHFVAPQDGAQFLEHVDQAERQQHLVEVVTVVEVPEQHFLQQQPEGHRDDGAAQDGQREAAEARGQEPGQVGAQHVEAAVRQVHHAHDPEDQRQAGGQHEQQQPVLDAVEQLDEEVGEVHSTPRHPRLACRRRERGQPLQRRHPRAGGDPVLPVAALRESGRPGFPARSTRAP
jgi:hypothetical protein